MAEDKKVKITGQVEVDQGKANSEMKELNAELAEFRAGMGRVQDGIGKILQALAFMAKGMAGTSAESQEAAQAAEDLAKEIDAAKDGFDGVEQGAEEANDATEKLGKNTEILRGFLQRIGHRAFDAVLSGLRGVASYMAGLISNADDFGSIFDRMEQRGVKNVNALKLAVVELAGALGEDLVAVAESVDLAEKLGAGDGAIEAARAAWENYRVTGMDVNRQLEVSTRLARAFNMEMGEQADLIRQVGQASQMARVSQEVLWNGISAMGPKVQQLGGTFQDLVMITAAGIAAGVKAEEEGLQGLNELISSLIKPSAEFGEKMVELGVIATQSAPQWRQLTQEANAQRRELEALNAELNRYKEETAEISLLTSTAERAMRQFAELNAKREAGNRLNRLEREAFKDLRSQMAGLNRELSAYDRAGNIVNAGEFRRLDTMDQLRQRIEAAKSAQEELNLASQEAQLDAQNQAASLQVLDSQLSVVSATLAQEIPAAVQQAISQGGLPKFIQELSAVPQALEPLSAEVKILVSTIGQSLNVMNANAQTSGAAVSGLGTQFENLRMKGVDAMTRLKNSIATIATMIIAPVSDSMNAVAQLIMQKLQEPFSDGSTIYQAIAAWSQNVGAAIVTDIDAVVSGDQTLGEVLRRWFIKALAEVQKLWGDYAQPMMDSLLAGMDAQMPGLRAWLIDQFTQLAADAAAAFGRGIAGMLDRYVGGSFDAMFQAFGATQGAATLGKLNLGAAGASSAAPVTTHNYTINGAGDPAAVAGEVMRMQSQQDRLGNNGPRLR